MPDTLHAIYSALLARLMLTAAHRNQLRCRGLPDVEIDNREYRTLPVSGRSRLARELYQHFRDSALSVPGIITRERDGRRYLTLAGAAGLLIPVRDIAGRIVALKIRRDDVGEGGRYSFMSSATHGGPGSGAPVHVPAGIQTPAAIVRLTEGDLKADVAFAQTGLPTISMPGVSSWRKCLELLKTMSCTTVRLALDADARDKPTVARVLEAAAQTLDAKGFVVELERWPSPHKGIDDALAAGAAVEVLTGDAARLAIAEIVTEGTAGERPHEASSLDRLEEVLAEGPEALFRDMELLRALAEVAENRPSNSAYIRARLRRAGVRVRELDYALAPFRLEIRAANSSARLAGDYQISAGRIVHRRQTREGPIEVPLCNFCAHIVESISRDDGAEAFTAFAVEGTLADGRNLPRVVINANDFSRMDWPTSAWQGRAVVLAGLGIRDHLRCAIELLSTDRNERTEYFHTGWRDVGGRLVYLHAAGAIGVEGTVQGISVALPTELSRFVLPAPPEGIGLRDAVRASLRLLDLGPPHLMFPLLGGGYRAVLGPCDFSLHLSGPTGTFKSETAALYQQHFGAGLDARHLPANWSSTGNALEALAFVAKDALIVIDDFAPTGPMADVQRLHCEADRFLRAQGNSAGRGRLSSDATLRQSKPPRGLTFSTGEDIPGGQSLRARMLVLEFVAGDIDVSRLTACQQDASAGRFAESMSGFLRFLAPRYASIRDSLRADVAEIREKAAAGTTHRRTPEIVANLFHGLRHFLDFAEYVGAIDAGNKSELLTRAWQALGKAAATQADHQTAAEPVAQFFRLLSAALVSGRAHVASPSGEAPAAPIAWGWRQHEMGADGNSHIEWFPQGRRVGWVDGDELFVEPESAFAEAQELAHSQGESLPISSQTLRKRIKDRGFLVSAEPGKLLTRRTLDGQRRYVIHVLAAALYSQELGDK